jgi:peptidoglycan hydrolase-like protein with peptidoglycan-binding domain
MKKEMMGMPAPMKLSKEAVVQLQEKLIELGYNPGPVDGIFGKRTAAALKKFQQDHGLSCTGTVDEKTQELLRL